MNPLISQLELFLEKQIFQLNNSKQNNKLTINDIQNDNKPYTLILNGVEINYQIKRTANRRSLTLTIDRRGLIARAPIRLAEEKIVKFIYEKADWIIPKITEIKKYQKQNENEIYICGQVFVINLADFSSANNNISPINFVNRILTLNKNEDKKTQIKKIIMELAQKEINKRLPYYAGKMNISSPIFKISNAESRWGSCSKTQGLTFSWKLGCVFPMLIDYVIVHELAHMTHMNHSPKFWSLVAKHFPAWKLARNQLREFEIKLANL